MLESSRPANGGTTARLPVAISSASPTISVPLASVTVRVAGSICLAGPMRTSTSWCAKKSFWSTTADAAVGFARKFFDSFGRS